MTLAEWVDSLGERFARWRSSRHALPNSVVHMFVQDVHAFVVPYGPHRGGAITGRLEGSAADVPKALLSLRSLAEHAHAQDPAEVIPDVVRTVVHHLLWRGYAAFSIAEPTKAGDRRRHLVVGEPTENQLWFRPLRPLPYGWTFRTPLGILEVFAGRDGWERRQRLVRFYPRHSIWLVDVPRALGGRWGFWLMMKKLARFSEVLPQWSSRALADEHTHLRFDATGYDRLRAAHHAVAASQWSWSARDVSTTYQTEFFAVYRTMAFHQSLAVLREHVVLMLNALLQRRLALDASVELSGLPSATEISAIRERMERGDISLLAALEQARCV